MKQATRRSFRIQLIIGVLTLLIGLVTVFGHNTPVHAAGTHQQQVDWCNQNGHPTDGAIIEGYPPNTPFVKDATGQWKATNGATFGYYCPDWTRIP